ncbi:hypothetical protein DPMN_082036 [Dreissena polymorpha]|uniref:Uncharacterized protein n=1 Tax=Dreissena polymorpha TaxID=45954 RepID=A0A9D4B9R8_DREPO|nr:hypothetical protein DPMN_082036 [Dreissena polymorpha]
MLPPLPLLLATPLPLVNHGSPNAAIATQTQLYPPLVTAEKTNGSDTDGMAMSCTTKLIDQPERSVQPNIVKPSYSQPANCILRQEMKICTQSRPSKLCKQIKTVKFLHLFRY